jgi:tRNA-specific 2-thiouridylase
VVNLMRDYREKVVEYLLDGYRRGLTPNPDIRCNREIKFGVFRAWAKENGFAAIATGHYARRVENAPGGFGGAADDCALLEGVDKNKDQSYFLTLLSQEQLRDACFPIGHLPKPELRAIAEAHGLATAQKKDSQGICFIGEVRMQDFLRQYVPDQPGPIVRATDQQVLGEHRGLHYYTIGQRRGIGVPSNADYQKYVVVGKRAEDNALLVAFDSAAAPGLFVSEIRLHSLRWNIPPPKAGRTLEGRVRYRDPRVALDFEPEGAEGATIRFHQPQRALASGQILALYEGERLLGGGVYV